jgi:hypothetical protein
VSFPNQLINFLLFPFFRNQNICVLICAGNSLNRGIGQGRRLGGGTSREAWRPGSYETEEGRGTIIIDNFHIERITLNVKFPINVINLTSTSRGSGSHNQYNLFFPDSRIFLFILDNPGHITAAPAAFPHEYQHAGVNFGGDIGDSCHIPALGAPNFVENLELSISGYNTPDIFGFGCKSILCFKNPSSDAIFPTNKTFTYFTMKKAGSYYIPFTIRISNHFRGKGHLYIPNCVASCAEFPLHNLHQLVRIREPI